MVILKNSSGHRSLDTKTNGVSSKVIKNGASDGPSSNSDADLEHLKVFVFFYYNFLNFNIKIFR